MSVRVRAQSAGPFRSTQTTIQQYQSSASDQSNERTGAMANTFSREQHLKREDSLNALKAKHGTEYQQLALKALWRGVRSTYGIDRNASSNTEQTFKWHESKENSYTTSSNIYVSPEAAAAKAARPQTAGPAASPSSIAARAPIPLANHPNPIKSYTKFADEMKCENFTRSNLFGTSFQKLDEFPTRTNPSVNAVNNIKLFAPASRPSSAYPASASRPQTAAASTRPSTAATTRSSYVIQEVARDPESNLPLKIGSFPAPTPVDPDGTQYFRDNSYTTSISYHHAEGRMGPGQKPTTRLGDHGVHTNSEAEFRERYLYRDPPMEEPLFSAFSPDHIFHVPAVTPPPTQYRHKTSVPRPLPNGQYEQKSQLFLQKLSKNPAGHIHTKPDMLITCSAQTLADTKAKEAASLVYTTVLESEEKKRRRKEKAEKLHRAQIKNLQRHALIRTGSMTHVSPPPTSKAAASKPATFDVQAYLDEGARTPNPAKDGLSNSSPPRTISPPRAISPNHLDRFHSLEASQQQADERKYEQNFYAAPTTSAPFYPTTAIRPQTIFLPSTTPLQPTSTIASMAMQRMLQNVSVDPTLAPAFAQLQPKSAAAAQM